MTIRTLYLPALIVAGVLMACAAALLAISQKKAEATFPGKNGRIAYQGSDRVIYTIHPGGGAKTKVTSNHLEGYNPSFSADGKKIAYTHYSDSDLPNEAAAVYKIAADEGKEVLVSDNNGTGALFPSWGPRP